MHSSVLKNFYNKGRLWYGYILSFVTSLWGRQTRHLRPVVYYEIPQTYSALKCIIHYFTVLSKSSSWVQITHETSTNITRYLYSRSTGEIRSHWNNNLACWIVTLLSNVLLCSVVEYLYSLYGTIRKNTHQYYTTKLLIRYIYLSIFWNSTRSSNFPSAHQQKTGRCCPKGPSGLSLLLSVSTVLFI